MTEDAARAPLVDVQEAARRLRAGEAVLLDVREPAELELARVDGALHIPMQDVPTRLTDIPKDTPVLVMCHHGMRSQAVADWLLPQGYKVENVTGGIDAWADEVDAGVGKY